MIVVTLLLSLSTWHPSATPAESYQSILHVVERRPTPVSRNGAWSVSLWRVAFGVPSAWTRTTSWLSYRLHGGGAWGACRPRQSSQAVGDQHEAPPQRAPAPFSETGVGLPLHDMKDDVRSYIHPPGMLIFKCRYFFKNYTSKSTAVVRRTRSIIYR